MDGLNRKNKKSPVDDKTRGKLLVIGSSGRLGRAILNEASLQGWAGVGLDPRPLPTTKQQPANTELHVGAIEDETLLSKAMQGVTHLIHTGGLHGEHLATHTLSDFLRCNVETVGNLIEQSLHHNIRNICLSSTLEVLVGRDYAASGAGVLDERSPVRPDSAYSISKVLQEQLGACLAQRHSASISSLRYMAFGYKSKDRLGQGLLSRYLTEEDAGRAAIQAVLTNDLRGEIFHIGPQSPLTNQDILHALKAPEEVLEKYYPGSLAIIKKSGQQIKADLFWPTTSIEKARQFLGWEPKYTFTSWLTDHGWTPSQH